MFSGFNVGFFNLGLKTSSFHNAGILPSMFIPAIVVARIAQSCLMNYDGAVSSEHCLFGKFHDDARDFVRVTGRKARRHDMLQCSIMVAVALLVAS